MTHKLTRKEQLQEKLTELESSVIQLRAALAGTKKAINDVEAELALIEYAERSEDV